MEYRCPIYHTLARTRAQLDARRTKICTLVSHVMPLAARMAVLLSVSTPR